MPNAAKLSDPLEAKLSDPLEAKLSDQLESWLTREGDQTLGGLVDALGERSFAVLLVLLLAVPALPVPTAGVTHVFAALGALVGLELAAGRREVWLPRRWQARSLSGDRHHRLVAALARLVRRLERVSRPRLGSVFDRRAIRFAVGALAIAGSAGAFFAPPFSGLDTLPALGVVVLALGMLLRDMLIAAAGAVVCAAGIGLEIALGAAALRGLEAIL